VPPWVVRGHEAAEALEQRAVGLVVALVGPAPGQQGRVVPQGTDDGLELLEGHASPPLILGVRRAGQRELLPHEEAQLVAGAVEGLLLAETSTPDAYGVDVGVSR